jgi:hypothetical protein
MRQVGRRAGLLRCRASVVRVRVMYGVGIAYVMALLVASVTGHAPGLALFAVAGSFLMSAFVMGRSFLEVNSAGVVRCNGFRTTRFAWPEVDHVLVRRSWPVRLSLKAGVVIVTQDASRMPLRIEGEESHCTRTVRRAVLGEARRRGIAVRRERD